MIHKSIKTLFPKGIKDTTQVIKFFKQLKKEKLNFHPDDPFSDYVGKNGKDTYTKQQAKDREYLLDQSFEICKKMNEDFIFELAMYVFHKQPLSTKINMATTKKKAPKKRTAKKAAKKRVAKKRATRKTAKKTARKTTKKRVVKKAAKKVAKKKSTKKASPAQIAARKKFVEMVKKRADAKRM